MLDGQPESQWTDVRLWPSFFLVMLLYIRAFTQLAGSSACVQHSREERESQWEILIVKDRKWLSTLAHIVQKLELSLRNTCIFKESSKSNCTLWKKGNRSVQYLIMNATNLNIYFNFNIIEEFLPLKKKIQFIHCG